MLILKRLSRKYLSGFLFPMLFQYFYISCTFLLIKIQIFISYRYDLQYLVLQLKKKVVKNISTFMKIIKLN